MISKGGGQRIKSGLYRYGFNGKEKDGSEEWGSTVYDYGFRIYNPSLAKFLSVDPLTSSYPWYTPYQFAGNKPIVAIDLDGLEPVSTNGEVIDQLEKSNLNNVNPENDPSAWDDLNSHSVTKKIKSASGETVYLQGIESNIGRKRNVDYYSLDIEKLPTNFTKDDLFDGFRLYLESFLGPGTAFKPFSDEDSHLWYSDNPLGAVMQFDGSPFPIKNKKIVDYLSDDLTVVVTDYKVAERYSYWIFSTALTMKNGGHAVSGSRQFGIRENDNGGYTFWTRGTDRAHNLFDALISPVVFAGGERIWERLFENINSFINDNGGQSTIVKPISERIKK
jgi:RHS repeat-associated protein